MSEYDVLIAGAGPVGLTAAVELSRRGIRVRVVDGAPGPAVTSRAMATHARTMEIWDQLGIADEVLRRGRRVVHFSLRQRGKLLVRFNTNYDALPTRFPFSLMIDQVLTEEILRNRLAELGGTIEWGTRLTDLTQDTDQVRVTLTHADGRTEQVAVPWLVGADGARSTVRKQLGLKLLGDNDETWLNADVVFKSKLHRNSNQLLLTGKGTLLCVPFPEKDKWRVVDTADADATEDTEVVRARIEEKLTRTLGYPVAVESPSWVSVFAVRQRMVERMRVGRCFVAGDAAHVHSPASGQGLNTGVQDGHNLAWKLADVIRGYADEELLDSYSAERVPIGATLLATTKTATGLIALRNALAPVALPVAMGLLNLLKPVKRKIEAKMMRGFSGLALQYDIPGAAPAAGIPVGQRIECNRPTYRESAGWRELITELKSTRWTLLVFGAGPTLPDSEALSVRTVQATEGGTARVLVDATGQVRAAFGAVDGDYALIRPDGYLAARGHADDADTLLAALRAARLTGRVPVDATA